jgi:hypothetical protein
MSVSYGKGVSYFYRFWQRLKNEIAQEVPEDYAQCEFNCKKLHCSVGDWENCENRLRSSLSTD